MFRGRWGRLAPGAWCASTARPVGVGGRARRCDPRWRAPNPRRAAPGPKPKAPCSCEDHGALLPMALVADVEEHVSRVGAVGHIADLVDSCGAPLSAYADYLLDVRGVARRTVASHLRTSAHFLEHPQYERAPARSCALSGRDLEAFLASQRQGRGSLQHVVAQSRGMLRFSHRPRQRAARARDPDRHAPTLSPGAIASGALVGHGADVPAVHRPSRAACGGTLYRHSIGAWSELS